MATDRDYVVMPALVGAILGPPFTWFVFWAFHLKHTTKGIQVDLLWAHYHAKGVTSSAADALSIIFFVILSLYLVFLAIVAIWVSRRSRIPPTWVAAAAIWVVVALISIFSYGYYLFGHWNVYLSHVEAIYVAVGTLTTAGTAGITPVSDSTRGLLILQNVADIVVVTVMGAFVLHRVTQGPQAAA